MQQTYKEHETAHRHPATIAGRLLSALDMEESLANSVYLDYLKRANWPHDISDEVFEEIRELISILLSDTRRHENIMKSIKSKLEANDG